MASFDVVVVGELNADLILEGEVTPVFGQTEKWIDQATLTLGSSSAIFACGAARLGLRVEFIGKVGDDLLGRFVMGELQNRGVDTSGVVVDPQLRTGLSVILSRQVDRAILTFAGSIPALRAEEIDRGRLADARHLHVGSYFLLDALRPDLAALFAEAQALGVSVSLDTNYDPIEQWDSGLWDVLDRVDVFLPNEVEACRISRIAGLQEALAMLAQRVPTVAIKAGARGGVARRGSETVTARVYPVNVVDTTGAGDSFDAGFVYGWLNGWHLGGCLRMAVACGSLSTRAAGGTTAQATQAEAMQLLASDASPG